MIHGDAPVGRDVSASLGKAAGLRVIGLLETEIMEALPHLKD